MVTEEAERVLRMALWACTWCDNPVEPGEPQVRKNGALYHRGCRAEAVRFEASVR